VDVALNWFTQGVIVAILAAVAVLLIPWSRAQARYGVLWTAYLLVLVLPTVPIVVTIASGGAIVDLVPAAVGPVVTMPTTWWTSAAVAAGLWIAWCCVQAVRLAVSAIGVCMTRRRARECPASVLARLPQWSRVSMTGRPSPVILSDRVRVAAVLGCGTPTIALSPTVIDQLDARDLDRVLVHEWAHVQRRDDIAQLAQRLVGIVIGWHPATWWLERQLDFEREAACDEIAVSVTGSAKAYATCLAMLAARPESRLASVGALAAASPSRLRARIVRILASPRDAAPRPWRAITVGAGSALLACTLVVADLELVRSAVTSAVASTALYVPRSEPLVKHLAAASGSAQGTEPPPESVATRRRESEAIQEPQTQEVLPPADTTEPIGELQAPAEAFEPLPASVLPIRSTGSLIAVPVEFGRLGQTADERSSWKRAADVGVEVGRASRDAGTATADMFRQFGVKLAGSF
jgi:beta-lactamase regulating signal transducer with metallopeptidase domain